ncbi:hypothetical protein CBER1_10215 [Cercospora berteroae]|uniref:Amino acid permease/ SLC12A domain-containing protein n=1 Tax=Cercospora berteroae TaxID=357750 RepID=A0A2S6CEQ8_9PEZI|nr:hypothetical protein CBER1_10215 [Cercospora berteroae]
MMTALGNVSCSKQPAISGTEKRLDAEHGPQSEVSEGEVLADRHSDVRRGLKSRHVQFIGLGGAIGTGLFLGIGRALAQAGPLSLFLGYLTAGIAIYCMMMSLGEMATWLPVPGAIPQFCTRYVDGALGFAVGWTTWSTAVITLCAEISAVCSLIQFWAGARDINVSAWIATLIVVVLLLNIVAVGIYGEAEFCFALIKVLAIVGLILLAIIITLGGAMNEYIARGNLGRFLGFWSTLSNAVFSFGGIEMVAVAAGEAEDPRRNVPKAIRRVFWRILVFYVLGAFVLGLVCPSNDPNLLGRQPGAASSPWVIAINHAGIGALPSIINVVIITSASSAANAFVYSGSRYLYALWFQNLTTISNMFTWMSVCVAYIRFHGALQAQNVSRDTLPFRSPFQPYLAYFGLGFFLIVTIFNGFDSIAGGWDYQGFLTSYIGVPAFVALFVGWKVLKRTRMWKLDEIDLFTGKAAIDAEEWPLRKPRNVVEKGWFWVA